MIGPSFFNLYYRKTLQYSKLQVKICLLAYVFKQGSDFMYITLGALLDNNPKKKADTPVGGASAPKLG